MENSGWMGSAFEIQVPKLAPFPLSPRKIMVCRVCTQMGDIWNDKGLNPESTILISLVNWHQLNQLHLISTSSFAGWRGRLLTASWPWCAGWVLGVSCDWSHAMATLSRLRRLWTSENPSKAPEKGKVPFCIQYSSRTCSALWWASCPEYRDLSESEWIICA